jgi:aflatoxin B1 aldehyde reductase
MMCDNTTYSACSEGGPLPDDALKLLDDAWAKVMGLVLHYGKRQRLLVVLHS